MDCTKRVSRQLLRLNVSKRRRYSAPTDHTVPPAKQKYIPQSGTYPKGFVVGSTHVGVKASNTRYDDLALIASKEPCPAAAVFTQNAFQAAPVQVSREILRRRANQHIRGVIINSGCANAVTGFRGLEDAAQMAGMTDQCFDQTSKPDDPAPTQQADEHPRAPTSLTNSTSTLVMSTGVIGQR